MSFEIVKHNLRNMVCSTEQCTEILYLATNNFNESIDKNILNLIQNMSNHYLCQFTTNVVSFIDRHVSDTCSERNVKHYMICINFEDFMCKFDYYNWQNVKSTKSYCISIQEKCDYLFPHDLMTITFNDKDEIIEKLSSMDINCKETTKQTFLSINKEFLYNLATKYEYEFMDFIISIIKVLYDCYEDTYLFNLINRKIDIEL